MQVQSRYNIVLILVFLALISLFLVGLIAEIAFHHQESYALSNLRGILCAAISENHKPENTSWPTQK